MIPPHTRRLSDAEIDVIMPRNPRPFPGTFVILALSLSFMAGLFAGIVVTARAGGWI